MIRLKNITQIGNIIYCDIIPEDSKESGKAEYDIINQDVVLFELPVGYEYCADDKAHIRAFFNKANIDDLPSEKLLMWY